ncbi:DUF6270 domain-containing protein [Bacillus pumilus]|uniref:DUF6270 domain-containing protein n=1 Tax=Bacillus pumilus TaxID=1408 RepID=UPI0011AAD875|nr:DUF6270 domain-containing protein [Bacillus pumilus]
MSILDLIYDENNGSMKVLVDVSEYNTTQLSFFLEKKNNSRDTELYEQIDLEFEQLNSTTIWLHVDLLEIFKTRVVFESFWAINLRTPFKIISLKFTVSAQRNFAYFTPDGPSLYKIRPYIAKDLTLVFFVRPIDVSAVLKDIRQDENNNVLLDLEYKGLDNQQLASSQILLSLIERDQPNKFFYSDEIIIPPKTTESSSLMNFYLKKELFTNIIRNNNFMDVSIKVTNPKDPINIIFKNQKAIYLKVKLDEHLARNFQKKKFSIDEQFSFLLDDSTDQLTIYPTDSQEKPMLIGYEEDDKEIKFSIDNHDKDYSPNSLEEKYLLLKRRKKLGKDVEYFDELIYPLKRVDGHKWSLDQKKIEMFDTTIIKGGEVWDVFIRSNCLNGSIDRELMTDEKKYKYAFKYFETESNFLKKSELKFFTNGKSNLSLFISDRHVVGKKPIKIAVMGTCFSRNAFSSREYFNPGYKKKYECVYTQFHSSLVSLVSSPVSFKKENFEDINDVDIKYIETDFKKDFFEKLKNSEPNYLILDLYCDAAKSLIQYTDGNFISASFMIEQTNYFKNLKDVKIINHQDNNRYFNIFKSAVDIFIDKVTEILPESKIILNKGRFTNSYRNKNGEIKSFDDFELIQRNNYFWDKVDNYFEYKAPNIKSIDLTNTHFIGDENYPFGKSFSHYESAYYKKFLDELNAIVLEDLQS